jgi:hypothetical protein
MLRTQNRPTRREALVGAASTVAAVALPALPAPTVKPAWLVAAEADLAADPWLGFNCFGPSTGLTILKGHDGVDPLLYDQQVRASLASALSKGEATMAPDGRLSITDRGRKVWHEEWLESRS